MMKQNGLKLFAVLLSLLLLFALASCGKEDNDKDFSEEAGAGAVAAADDTEPPEPADKADKKADTALGGRREETPSATGPKEKGGEEKPAASQREIHLPVIDIG